MRRTFSAVFLSILLALPVWAQHRGGGHFGGRAAGRAPAARGIIRTPVARGGMSLGRAHWNVVINGRPGFRGRPYWGHHRRDFDDDDFDDAYRYPYAYPYVIYPAYPFYDTFDSSSYAVATTPAPYVTAAPAPYVITTPQPYYPYSADDQVGLDTQMRQQHVGIYRQPAQPQGAPAQPAPAAPQPEQPLTVLVYRDGHSAEVHNYAIVGQTLWIFSEERAQKVPLSDLNLEATRKANEDRGVEFQVPPAK